MADINVGDVVEFDGGGRVLQGRVTATSTGNCGPRRLRTYDIVAPWATVVEYSPDGYNTGMEWGVDLTGCRVIERADG